MDAYAKSKTPQDARDKRGTPPELSHLIMFNLKMRWVVDVCAEPHTKKAAWYWTEEDDALKKDWYEQYHDILIAGVPVTGGVPAFWMNPPYSDPETWCKKAKEEAAKGCIVVGLLPDDRSTAWYRNHVKHGANMVYVTDKRIPFLDEHGVPQFGNPKGSVIVIWTPWAVHETQETYFHIPPDLVKLWRYQAAEAKKARLQRPDGE